MSAPSASRPQNRDKSVRPPAPQMQSSSTKKPLTIIEYCPDPAKRKAARRAQVQANSQAASKGRESTKDALVDYPKPPTTLERIPSSRSWDPFNALAVLYVSKEERFVLNYAYTTSWAVWEDKATGSNKFAQAWMWRSMESAAAFYAQIVGAASHYQISRRDTPITSQSLASVRLQAKAKAMERLRREIDQYHKKSKSVPFDSLLMAIFALAVHDNVDLSSPDESHPLSTLARVRDMHVYGRVVFGEEHMNAMYRLLEQKGGLSEIDTNAFGAVVPLLDMMYSARTQTPPRLPCFRSLKPLRVETVWEPDDRAEELLESHGYAFHADSKRAGSPILPLRARFRTLLSVLAELSVALDHVQRDGLGVFKDASIFLGNCDWMGHRLLSMPSFLAAGTKDDEKRDDSEDEDGGGSDASESTFVSSTAALVGEVCRLAALLFVDMIFYPTPPLAGVKNKLSGRLLPLLEAVQDTSGAQPTAFVDLVLWASLVGAISAKSTENEEAYIEFIAENCVEDYGKWDDIESKLMTFVWLKAVFDEPAMQIWDQARVSAGLIDEQ